MTTTLISIDVTDIRTGERTRHEFHRFPVSIGRVARADLQLLDSRISAIHACLEYVEGVVQIHDSSRNGTSIDGDLLRTGTRRRIDATTTIEIGPYRLRVRQIAMAPCGAPTAARPAAPRLAPPPESSPPPAPCAAPPRRPAPAMPAGEDGHDEVADLLGSFERKRQAPWYSRFSELLERLTRAPEPAIEFDDEPHGLLELPPGELEEPQDASDESGEESEILPGEFDEFSEAPAEFAEPDRLEDMPGSPPVAACPPPCSPTLVPEARVLDLALPLAPVKAETCQLFVLIRLPASTGLLQRLADGTSAIVPESVTSSDMLMEFFTLADGSAVPVSLIVRLDSADFAFAPDSKRVRLHRGRDAALLCFELTPLRTGLVRVAVEVSLESDVIGAGLVNRTCLERTARAPVSGVAYGDMSLNLDFRREASQPAAQPVEALFHTFLCRSFTAEELHRWICLHFRGWRNTLPDAGGSITALAFAVLDTGQREGRIDDGFFAALMRHLPRRAAQIRELRDRWEAAQERIDPWPRDCARQAMAAG